MSKETAEKLRDLLKGKTVGVYYGNFPTQDYHEISVTDSDIEIDNAGNLKLRLFKGYLKGCWILFRED